MATVPTSGHCLVCQSMRTSADGMCESIWCLDDTTTPPGRLVEGFAAAIQFGGSEWLNQNPAPTAEGCSVDCNKEQ
jgi:hypothetical protein